MFAFGQRIRISLRGGFIKIGSLSDNDASPEHQQADLRPLLCRIILQFCLITDLQGSYYG